MTFEFLAHFCRDHAKSKVSIPISTLHYMELIDRQPKSTISDLVSDDKDIANITALVKNHKPWFVCRIKNKNMPRGRPPKVISLSKKGKKLLENARAAYIKGLKDELTQ